MKLLSSLVLVVLLAQSAVAQWLPTSPTKYDRGRVRAKSIMRSLAIPQEPANWLFPNVNISRSPSTWGQTEPAIAINPRSPSNVVIGYIDDSIVHSLAFSYTTDDRTWNKGLLPVTSLWTDYENAYATDPSVAFNSEGVAYYLLGRQADQNGIVPNDVALYRSADFGASWQWLSCPFADTLHHGFADSLADKYYLAVDTSSSSPYRDHLRATWIEYKASDSFVAFASSSDNGATWSSVKHLSRSGLHTSPIPAITLDGTIIVTFEQYWDTSALWVTHSTDGGKSFSTPQIIAFYKDLGPIVPNNNTGHQTIGPSSNLVGVNSFPSITFSKVGRTYITWSGMGDDGVPHVFLSTSDDNGATWSPPRIVDADSVVNAYSRYYPSVAADPVSGDIAIEYYCVPSGPDNMQADQYFAHSTDSGRTFTARRITSLPSLLTVTQASRDGDVWFYGDYINLAGYNETWHPVWTDSRTGTDNEIYTATVQPYAPLPVVDPCARDTIIGGQPAEIIRWSYSPQTTFGYALPKSYYFIVDKGGSFDTIRNGIKYDIDTTADTLKNYAVTVVGGQYKSIPITASRCDRSFVSEDLHEEISVVLSHQPVLSNKTETVNVHAENACSLSFAVYDELGRQLAAIEGNAISTEHTLRFTPLHSGAMYYVVKGMTAFGSWQRSGRFLTLPGE